MDHDYKARQARIAAADKARPALMRALYAAIQRSNGRRVGNTYQNTTPALVPANLAAFSPAAAGRAMRRAVRWQAAHPEASAHDAPSHIRTKMHLMEQAVA